jgi:regulator of Ty1 transposition protein 109
MVTKSLLEALADALPLDLELLFYHISTPPTSSPALFSAPPGEAEAKTFCESHFIAASLPAKGSLKEELLVFAIEVLVFTTQNLTTIFVSKADSTGYLHLVNAQPGSPSAIKAICTTVLSYLIKEKLDGHRVVLSLFARSQNQYLFPGSIENPGKHVLDDRQLIKWWCRTLDPVLRNYGPPPSTLCMDGASNIVSEAYIIVPGCDTIDTKALLPPSIKADSYSRWSTSYPRDLIVPDNSAPPRCLVPRFPDDPKARFLDDLDAEISDSDRSIGDQWRSVKSLDQFWEMMSYRQECSAGRLVGFIWVVCTPSEPERKDMPHLSAINGFSKAAGLPDRSVEQLPIPNQSQINNLAPVPPPPTSDDDAVQPIKAASCPPSSPFHQPTNESDLPPISNQSSTSPQIKQKKQSPPPNLAPNSLSHKDDNAETTSTPTLPTNRNSPLLLTSTHYALLQSYLLASDFSTQSLAAQSTFSWTSKASELSGTSDWRQSVIGRAPVVPIVQSNEVESNSNMNVNVLKGVRKKRKVDGGGGGREVAPATLAIDEARSVSEPVTLPMDLVGKKRKATS